MIFVVSHFLSAKVSPEWRLNPTLLGWDDSPMNVMETLVSRLELGSLAINLGMAWAKS